MGVESSLSEADAQGFRVLLWERPTLPQHRPHPLRRQTAGDQLRHFSEVQEGLERGADAGAGGRGRGGDGLGC